MSKYKCIVVKSLTYAQKALKILMKKGFEVYMMRQAAGTKSGCGRCIRLSAADVPRAVNIMREYGVEMTGEIFDA